MVDYAEDIAGARQSIIDAGIVCQLDRDGSAVDAPAVLTRVDPRLVDGDLIRFTDTSALLPGGLDRNPDEEQDRFVVPPCELFPDGDSLRIVKASPFAPNGQVIIWELVLRK